MQSKLPMGACRMLRSWSGCFSRMFCLASSSLLLVSYARFPIEYIRYTSLAITPYHGYIFLANSDSPPSYFNFLFSWNRCNPILVLNTRILISNQFFLFESRRMDHFISKWSSYIFNQSFCLTKEQFTLTNFSSCKFSQFSINDSMGVWRFQHFPLGNYQIFWLFGVYF